MNVGGVSAGDDEAQRQAATRELQLAGRWLQELDASTPGERSFQWDAQTLAGSMLRIVATPIRGADAAELSRALRGVAQTPAGDAAPKDMLAVARTTLAKLHRNDAPEADKYPLMGADFAVERLLLGGAAPAKALTVQVSALMEKFDDRVQTAPSSPTDMAVRRVLGDLYALAATVGHSFQKPELRRAVATLVDQAGALIGGNRAVTASAMLLTTTKLSVLVGQFLDPAVRARAADAIRSVTQDLGELGMMDNR